MSMTGISGSESSQRLDAMETFRGWADKKLRPRGDTVTISEEARQKAEETAEARRSSENAAPEETGAVSGERSAGAQASTPGKDAGGGVSEDGSSDQMEDLEGRIKALADQLAAIMQGALPLENKMQQAQPVQQQMGQLEAQLSQLKAQALQAKNGKS